MLAGVATFGASFLTHMEGMWAFALWDAKTGAVLLSRDRMGKKPLFYQLTGRGFTCASELPALKLLSSTAWSEDPASTADYLRYGYYLPGTTAYRNVREVLPGHTLRWSVDSGASEKPYWQLSVGNYPGSYAQACNALKEKMISAVQRRMVADVEVGAFLSGGIDSSLIVGIMTQKLDIHPKTFTIGFENKTYDESGYAKITSRLWGTDHHEHRLQSWDPGIIPGGAARQGRFVR